MPSKRTKPYPAYGITRVDANSIHGYRVRMGEHVNEWFSDRKCGSRRKALKAAKVHRDREWPGLEDHIKNRALSARAYARRKVS